MKFSILTPTLDRPEFLNRAIRSVLNQDHEDWEQIVYNVGAHEVRVPADARIKLFRGDRQGPALDFQFCLEQATGDVITPLSDDDRLAPGALSKGAGAIGDRLWLNGLTAYLDHTGRQLGQRGERVDLRLLRKRFELGGAVYWRKELTDRLGGFDPVYDGAADHDLYLRFAEDSEPAFVPEELYLYTDHPGTDTNTNSSRQSHASYKVAEAAKTRPLPEWARR